MIVGGENEQTAPAGKFEQDRATELWNDPETGVIVTSAAFGAGHLLQGADAAIATGLLGAFWSVIYLRRRSCVAPMVSHAGFDLIQVAQYLGFK